jgi:hypothetical protein
MKQGLLHYDIDLSHTFLAWHNDPSTDGRLKTRIVKTMALYGEILKRRAELESKLKELQALRERQTALEQRLRTNYTKDAADECIQTNLDIYNLHNTIMTLHSFIHVDTTTCTDREGETRADEIDVDVELDDDYKPIDKRRKTSDNEEFFP